MAATREMGRVLVYRLLNPLSIAAGQLAVFQGASEVPISESYGSSEQRGKTANRDPESGVENGSAASFRRRYTNFMKMIVGSI
jgi:hypothetical protein